MKKLSFVKHKSIYKKDVLQMDLLLTKKLLNKEKNFLNLKK